MTQNNDSLELEQLDILRGLIENASNTTVFWLHVLSEEPGAAPWRLRLLAVQQRFASLGGIIARRMERRELPEDEPEFLATVSDVRSLLEEARKVSDDLDLRRCWVVSEGLAQLVDRLPGGLPGNSTASTSATEAASKPPGAPFTHSDDYRSVTIRGQNFTLTSQQAHVIQILDESRRNGFPDVGKDYLLEKLETPNTRLRDSFKSDPLAWKALVMTGTKKGTVRLNV
jgi:hypothetical protein